MPWIKLIWIMIGENNMKKIICILLLSSLLYSSEISEYLYRPIPMDLNDATIVINNTEADKEVFPHDGTPNIVINNYVSRDSQVIKPFDNWVVDDWTGLVDASEQWGYADSASSIVEYGATSLQVKNKETGIFLNTFSHNLVTNNTATSIQYVVGWAGSENFGADLWNTRPNDDLCVAAQLDLHHSFVSDNNNDGVAAVNQALITYIFRINGSDKSFFYNIELHDSRPTWNNVDTIMAIDGQDTNLPIVITYAHANGTESIYSKAIPNFGTQLQEFTTGTLPSGTKVYGSCIDRSRMLTIINDIKTARNDFNIPQFTIENLRLDTVIIGPEINTNPTNTYRENGNMGMNLKEFTVYKLTNESSSNVLHEITYAEVNKIFNNYAILSWTDDFNNELGFKIYQGDTLIATVGRDITTYEITNLIPGTLYTYTIKAYNADGESKGVDVSFKTKDDYSWLIPIYHLILN